VKIITVTVLAFFLFFSFQSNKEKIKRIGQPAISGKILKVIPHYINFSDTISNDTLYAHLGENDIPLKYSRKIICGVCIDGKCRLVNIEIFWNITGRYLGYELPKGEFLSKTEHVKFNAVEYNSLHLLLADPFSPLANYSLDELVPEMDSSINKVDAVSSATIAAVLDYIVEDAVYTTYTLWHIVYGTTKREIEKITSETITSEIALKLLDSSKLEDQAWTLNHIAKRIEISPDLQRKLLDFISGDDIYLASRSLNALKPKALTYEIQRELSNIFDNVSFLQKRLILQKLKEAPKLHPEIATHFSMKLRTLNSTLTKNLLELFNVHNIKSDEVMVEVAKLLSNKNRFIAKQAFLFLDEIEVLKKQTSRRIEKYKKENK
jgi:hypothetical protein